MTIAQDIIAMNEAVFLSCSVLCYSDVTVGEINPKKNTIWKAWYRQMKKVHSVVCLACCTEYIAHRKTSDDASKCIMSCRSGREHVKSP